MEITLNKSSALYVLRKVRSGDAQAAGFSYAMLSSAGRTNAIANSPYPGKRWTARTVALAARGLLGDPSRLQRVSVAVASPSSRLKLGIAENTVYSGEGVLPPNAFIDFECGLLISSPELVFAEMASELNVAQLALLGYELCGSFSRDPDDPRNGNIALGVKPATSVGRLASFVRQLKWCRYVDTALAALEPVADNAWSPTEAVVALMASLPVEEFGYGLGKCCLNVDVPAPDCLKHANSRGLRIPDILLAGTNVGINYDGAVHLNLGRIADAAVEVGRHPEQLNAEEALARAIRSVRAKVVDDILRNRELMASGYYVFPVVKEDLYGENGLDGVMAQAIATIQATARLDLSVQERMLALPFAKARRKDLLRSLLPGAYTERIIGSGKTYGNETSSIVEVMVGI